MPQICKQDQAKHLRPAIPSEALALRKHALQVCLQNQIKDLIAEDKERAEQGRVPQHLVTRYTFGSESLVRAAPANHPAHMAERC